MFKHKLFTSIVIIALFALAIPIQPARAQFVLAEWDYPDEYGQGIDGLKFYENSTGSWVAAPYYTHYYPDYHEELGEFYYLNYYQTDYTYNWSAGAAMKVRANTFLNSTLTGAVDLADGRNYFRHNVTVYNADTLVFSQNNFTYLASDNLSAPMYWYQYYCILNFIPVDGQIYTVTVTYEVWY